MQPAEDAEKPAKEKEPGKTPKEGVRRPAGDIPAKLEAYISTDWSELDSDVQAFIFGIQKGLAFALNHDVDFSEIVPFTFGFTDVPVIPEATSAPEDEEDEEVLEGFTESWQETGRLKNPSFSGSYKNCLDLYSKPFKG